ncbi:uncharacterized protein LOC122361622 isoform X3 [Puntigrus tetrazona]|uniref:uncharacterized protein LOC122361622 isoform X3 n=1 Tax=Puntigrus tetrazona TaxID=1606681 RepID=UPI001C89433E|nr:uncharacterized protein LOC122361622 isoform X3 [Puntigrus tetrazona]
MITYLKFLKLISFCSVVTYCVTTGVNVNKLFFGTGTKLIIRTNEKKEPSYFKIEDSCLATDFTDHRAVNFENKNITPVRYKDQSYYSSFAFHAGDECKDKVSCETSSADGGFESDEKINYLSLGLYWLRILFMKTVVFNILITFKAWMS